MFKNASCLFQQTGNFLSGYNFLYGTLVCPAYSGIHTHTQMHTYTHRSGLLLIHASIYMQHAHPYTRSTYTQGLLVARLRAGCRSRSVSIHNATGSALPPPPVHCWCDAHFIVGCHVAAPSGTFIQPWWVFWVHILIPSWCAHLRLLRFTALSSVSLSWRHHYAFCWIMQLNWK